MPEDRSPDQDDIPAVQQRVTFRISRVHARMNAQATRILKKHADLSLSQWRVMVMIDRSGRTTAAEIVRETQIDKGLISRTIKGMTDDGLITQATSTTDQRASFLELTPEGRARFAAARPHMLGRQGRLIGALSKPEREAFFRTIDKLEDVLDALDADLDL